MDKICIYGVSGIQVHLFGKCLNLCRSCLRLPYQSWFLSCTTSREIASFFIKYISVLPATLGEGISLSFIAFSFLYRAFYCVLEMLALNFLSLLPTVPDTYWTGIFVALKKITSILCCLPVVGRIFLVCICSSDPSEIFAYGPTGVFYYMSALPTIALFGLKLNRLSAFLGCIIMFSLYAVVLFSVAPSLKFEHSAFALIVPGHIDRTRSTFCLASHQPVSNTRTKI
jgi:hypothetical protein